LRGRIISTDTSGGLLTCHTSKKDRHPLRVSYRDLKLPFFLVEAINPNYRKTLTPLRTPRTQWNTPNVYLRSKKRHVSYA
jgi:hypothetical protein